jgi:hypothetical protein
MSASPDVVWQCIKNGNAFLRKGSNGRQDPIFSSEPGNLYARHSFKFSGAQPVCCVRVRSPRVWARRCAAGRLPRG